VVNLVVHRSAFPQDKVTPSLKVHGHAGQSRPGDIADTHGLLPFAEKLIYLGPCSSALHLLEVPRYEEMLRYACTTQQWDLDEFDIYRARIEYPMLDTTIDAALEMD
jgi:hypothetical protein